MPLWSQPSGQRDRTWILSVTGTGAPLPLPGLVSPTSSLSDPTETRKPWLWSQVGEEPPAPAPNQCSIEEPKREAGWKLPAPSLKVQCPLQGQTGQPMLLDDTQEVSGLRENPGLGD